MDDAQEILRLSRNFMLAKPSKKTAVTGHTTRRTAVQESLAMSCDPSQVAEFREHARKAGLTAVSYDNDGTCYVPSFGPQRKAFFKLRGAIDRGEGY